MKFKLIFAALCFVSFFGPSAPAQEETLPRRPQTVPTIAGLDEAILSLEARIAGAAPGSSELTDLGRKLAVHLHVKTSLLAPAVPVTPLPENLRLQELMRYLSLTLRPLTPRVAVTDWAPLRVASQEFMTYTYQSFSILPECVETESDPATKTRFIGQYQDLMDGLLSKIQEVKAAVENEDVATLRVKMTEARQFQVMGHGGVPAGPNGEPAIPGFLMGCVIP